MRLWLVILMILFTPLRGMAADVMAITMAAQQGAPAHHGLAPAAITAVAAPTEHADCAGHALAPAAVPADTDTQAGFTGDTCPTCASCMVCSSAALAVQLPVAAMVSLHHGVPSPRTTPFSSAAPLPGFKPPIS